MSDVRETPAIIWDDDGPEGNGCRAPLVDARNVVALLYWIGKGDRKMALMLAKGLVRDLESGYPPLPNEGGGGCTP